MLRAVSDEQLQGVADAIKLKSGDDTPMSVADMALRIGLIEGNQNVHCDKYVNQGQSRSIQIEIGDFDNYCVINSSDQWINFGYRVVNGVIFRKDSVLRKVLYTNAAGTSHQIAISDYSSIFVIDNGVLMLNYSSGLGYYPPVTYEIIAWNDF